MFMYAISTLTGLADHDMGKRGDTLDCLLDSLYPYTMSEDNFRVSMKYCTFCLSLSVIIVKRRIQFCNMSKQRDRLDCVLKEMLNRHMIHYNSNSINISRLFAPWSIKDINLACYSFIICR